MNAHKFHVTARLGRLALVGRLMMGNGGGNGGGVHFAHLIMLRVQTLYTLRCCSSKEAKCTHLPEGRHARSKILKPAVGLQDARASIPVLRAKSIG